MVVAQKVKEAEITEQDSLLLTRNLLRIAIYNISYIRGLFPEKYFNDKSVPALEMKIKKLMPMDDESRRLIDWMEKGVYDALQKKYLKTLIFCICEKPEGPMIEEYSFSFSYPNPNEEEVSMNITSNGNKKTKSTFKCNSTDVSPDQMRSSACKMVRTLVTLMRTLDQMPEERTILMKLLYYDVVTPDDYEPPFFRGCTETEAVNIWSKNPLKMEVGNVNSKHLVLALKVKSVLDPCEDETGNADQDDLMSLGGNSGNDTDSDSSSDSEIHLSEANRYMVAPNNGPNGETEHQTNGSISEDETQDNSNDEEQTVLVREWIGSRSFSSVDLSDVLSNFQDLSLAVIEDVMDRLVKEGLLTKAGKDSFTVNKGNCDTPALKQEVIMQDAITPEERNDKGSSEDLIYMKALYHALPMDYVTVAKLQSKLEGEANQATVRKLIERMLQDGYLKNSPNRRLGKLVLHSEATNKKLMEVKKILEVGLENNNTQVFEFDGMDAPKDEIMRDKSTMGCFDSVGSDVTRTKERSQMNRTDMSLPNGREQSRTPMSMHEPVESLESGVPGPGQRIRGRLNGASTCTSAGGNSQFKPDKRSRKSSTVKEPILQPVKRMKTEMQ
ncbi:hypothetical protein LUZ60_015629 [Juncus effusus]|nr:hypothetical protein LUZ60_015629 [Juncus effusus]